jgi:hypothetical protein
LKGVVSGNHGAAVITVPASGLVPNGTFGGGTAVAQVFVEAASGSVTITDLTVDGSGASCPSMGSLMGIAYAFATSGTVSNSVIRNIGSASCPSPAIDADMNSNLTVKKQQHSRLLVGRCVY